MSFASSKAALGRQLTKWRWPLARFRAMDLPVGADLTARRVSIRECCSDCSSRLPASSFPIAAQKETAAPICAAASAVNAPPPPTDSSMCSTDVSPSFSRLPVVPIGDVRMSIFRLPTIAICIGLPGRGLNLHPRIADDGVQDDALHRFRDWRDQRFLDLGNNDDRVAGGFGEAIFAAD